MVYFYDVIKYSVYCKVTCQNASAAEIMNEVYDITKE